MRPIFKLLSQGLVAAGLIAGWSQAQALVVSFDELLTGVTIGVRCELEGCVTAATDERASASGLIRPATSAAPLTVGVRFATMLEPAIDPFGPRISDIIRLTVDQIGQDAVGLFQRITLDFWSDGAPDFPLLTFAPPGLLETGDFQDFTSLLGIGFPNQNVQVLARSDLGGNEAPEPGTLALLGLALLGVGAARKRIGT